MQKSRSRNQKAPLQENRGLNDVDSNDDRVVAEERGKEKKSDREDECVLLVDSNYEDKRVTMAKVRAPPQLIPWHHSRIRHPGSFFPPSFSFPFLTAGQQQSGKGQGQHRHLTQSPHERSDRMFRQSLSFVHPLSKLAHSHTHCLDSNSWKTRIICWRA